MANERFIADNDVKYLIKTITAFDKSFLATIIIYGIAVSLLSLTVPVSVQVLISSVSFTAMLQPILVIGAILFILLSFYSILNVLQFFVCEIFQRKIFAYYSAQIADAITNDNILEYNKKDLAMRFFEINNLQKIVPKLLTKTFALILQTIVGLMVVAFYHPLLLLFSVLIILSLIAIWKLFCNKGFVTSIYESKKKYEMAHHLSKMAQDQSEINADKITVDEITAQYIIKRREHFRVLMMQKILLLILYVFASAAILISGGYLILKGQLTMGQLVAAELILSAILYNLSQFAFDFENVYDLAASCEKLYAAYKVNNHSN